MHLKMPCHACTGVMSADINIQIQPPSLFNEEYKRVLTQSAGPGGPIGVRLLAADLAPSARVPVQQLIG